MYFFSFYECKSDIDIIHNKIIEIIITEQIGNYGHLSMWIHNIKDNTFLLKFVKT